MTVDGTYTVLRRRFFFVHSGRKMVFLPIQQMIRVTMIPAKMPMLSMLTSLAEGPRPATKDW